MIASWRRSSDLHRLDPAEGKPPNRLTDFDLQKAREKIEPVLRAAQSSLDRLYFAVGGVGCCVLLADRSGVPVERRGSPCDDMTFRSWGSWWGRDLERRSRRHERHWHMLDRATCVDDPSRPAFLLAKCAAELHNCSCLQSRGSSRRRSRRIVLPRRPDPQDLLDLIAVAVSDTAKKIEAECFRLAYPSARILVAPCGQQLISALIAIDKDDLVIGATRAARLGLGITQERLQTLPAVDLFDAAREAS